MAFSNITGQDQAVSYLESVLKRGKLPHALLFTGPEGTGKKLSALTLSSELNCRKGEPGGACGKCSDCRQIMRSAHPDTAVISPEGKAGEIRIETIRALRREIHLKPVRGRYKIFILEEADRLNTEGANALLKVLEEPPAQSIIILLTSKPHSLLPTIISRCQSVKFRTLGIEDTISVLSSVSGAPAGALELAARLSEGSPGKALSIAESGLERRNKIFGWAFGEYCSGTEAVGTLELLKSGEEKAGINVKDTAQKRANLATVLEMLLSWYRDVLTAAAGGDKLVNADFSESIKKHAAELKADGAGKALKELLRARGQVEAFANPRLVFEVAMIKTLTAGRG